MNTVPMYIIRHKSWNNLSKTIFSKEELIVYLENNAHIHVHDWEIFELKPCTIQKKFVFEFIPKI